MRLFGRKSKGKTKKHDEKKEKLKKKQPLKSKKPEKEKKAEPKKEEKKPEVETEEVQKPVQKARRRAFLPKIKFVPRFYEKWVARQLSFAGSERDPNKFIRKMFIVSLAIGIGAGFLLRAYMLYVIPMVFFLLFILFNFLILLSVDRRSRFVDEILPDALMLVSANIRSGYIPSRALILSARKEFGPLAEAIKRSGKKIMSGDSLEDGLREIPSRIKSEDLRRTIDLIVQGIRGGGRIVALLEENAIDIRRRQAIKKEIKANTMMYAIFIAFAGCLGAPGLYALSGYLTGTMSKLSPDISQTSGVSSKVSFIKLSGVKLSEEFLFQFSLVAILVTTIFGGLILGLISTGREKEGLKYAPILSLIAILTFLAASFLLRTMFAGMMP